MAEWWPRRLIDRQFALERYPIKCAGFSSDAERMIASDLVLVGDPNCADGLWQEVFRDQ